MPLKSGEKTGSSVRGSRMSSNHADGIEASPQHSQTTGSDLDVVRLMQQMSDAARARRGNKRSTIEKHHSNRVEKASTQIHRAYGQFSTKLNAIRKAQLEELEKLLDQKHEIENEITVSLHTVNQVFAEVSEQFATVLRGRAHELE